MALPFNPFDKPLQKSSEQTKKQYTKVKVFERAAFETEQNNTRLDITEQNETELDITEQDQTELIKTAQNKTQLGNTKQDKTKPDRTAQNKTEQNNAQPNTTVQSGTDLNSETEQNQTKPNTTLNKKLDKSEQNRARQERSVRGADEMILSLTGIRKRVMNAIYEVCLQNNDLEIETNYSNWADLAQINFNSIKTTVRGLKDAGYFEIAAPKGGRGALIVVRVNQDLLLSFSKYQTQLNKKLHTTLNKTAPSSSRKLSFKESSTSQQTVADELGSLDLSNLRQFGVTVETFKRAVQLNPTVTIEGLSDLSFRLSELFKNPKERAKIQNARGFVIKLVEQLAQGITPLDHIETPEERLMREYAAAAKKKRLEQKDFEEEILQAAFEKWNGETLDEEKFQAVPLAEVAPSGNPRLAVFREYFREKVWPSEREAMLKGQT
jgi:hypothetical protein